MPDTDALDRITIKQSRGPTLAFDGKLLASTEWETRENVMRMELWQTRGGALIPVTRTESTVGRPDFVEAGVIEPDELASDGDVSDAMRFAVLDFWDWENRARSMVRELGWKLKREIA